jgi:hypothetical protein
VNGIEFTELLNGTFKRLMDLTATKGREYANSDDQLANFRRLSVTLGISSEAVCFTYLAKHLDSIQSHLRCPEKPLSEPIAGRIDDAILYLVLLKALIQCSEPDT